MLLGMGLRRLRPLAILSGIQRPLQNLQCEVLGLGGSCLVRPSSSWKREEPHSSNWTGLRAAVGGALLVGGVWIWSNRGHIQAASVVSSDARESEEVRPKLPFYTAAQVAEHYDAQKRIWISFNRGVYDITDFVAQHPGGDRILMGAGGSVESFWELYPVHQSPHVLGVLSKYRVGNLAAEDVVGLKPGGTADHFAQEPRRHPALIARSARPFNGETPPTLLQHSFYTPNDLFYVRNHLPVPNVDAASYELEVEGLHLPGTRSFRLKDILAFPRTSISATIQCGGNRRSEMGTDQPVAGLAWTGGAIGNAKWTGVRLRDLLKAAGFDPLAYEQPDRIHVQFEGLDSDASGECYGASVPLSYILDNNFEAILAYEMNGKPLPVDHGFPIRIILPGIVGARSVKWLGRIRISEEESGSPWQQRDYKVFSPSVRMETVDFASAPAIMDTPVTSYIASHEPNQKITTPRQLLKGYAFSGGGRDIVRVEVSTDKGKSWKVANLFEKKKDGCRNWAWVLWELDVDLGGGKGQREVWVKAVDSGYNQQSEDFRNIWNYRGLLANAYHKIRLQIV